MPRSDAYIGAICSLQTLSNCFGLERMRHEYSWRGAGFENLWYNFTEFESRNLRPAQRKPKGQNQPEFSTTDYRMTRMLREAQNENPVGVPYL
jgi:hypothetical protein